MTERTISDEFIYDLQDGKLSFFLKKVKENGSLFSLEIRENKVNVYYKGGSLLMIEEKEPHEYNYKFDIKYGKRKQGVKVYKDGKVITTKLKSGEEKEIYWCPFAAEHYNDIEGWKEKEYEKYFYDLRDVMDGWFVEHPKNEREYQHYVSLNNNNVIDIEYAIGESGMRLDMVMIEHGELYLIENKFGNSAISSASTKPGEVKPGLKKHYQDFITVVRQDELVKNITASMLGIIEVKKKLGIMPSEYEIKLENGKPIFHILFVLADLSLSKKSKIIDNEIEEIVKANEPDILEAYPPYVLITGKKEYVMDFDKKVRLLDFHL